MLYLFSLCILICHGSDAWVTAWEVKRYRLDKDKVWRYKGSIAINEPHLVWLNRTTVSNLENNTQYRFSVVGTNVRGTGFESAHSAPVMIEAPLPSGWFRFWDENIERFFYSNIKIRSSSWTRPELDPWFLDESIMLLFSKAEIAHQRELFEEEIAHFGRVTTIGFRRILEESGVAIGMQKTVLYFQSCVGKESTNKWTEYMLLISTIKRRMQRKDRGSTCWGLINSTCCLPCYCYNEIISASVTGWRLYGLVGDDAYHAIQKIGNWRVEWSEHAERNCYINEITKEQQWDTPEEVRFYLPKKMEDQLLEHFNEGDLQDFRVRFAHLDINNSGAIDQHEFKLLLESLGLNVSDSHRRKLVKEIDMNGNGTIEFHEFCFMMLQLQKQKLGANSIWDQIKVVSDDRAKLQAITQDIVAASVYEAEHGTHDQRHNPHYEVRHHTTSQMLEKLRHHEHDQHAFVQSEALKVKRTQEVAAKKALEESQTFQEMLAEEDQAARSPVKQQAWAVHLDEQKLKAQEAVRNALDTQKSTKERSEPMDPKLAERLKDRSYRKEQIRWHKERGLPLPVYLQPTSGSDGLSYMSKFQHLSRPANPDEQNQLETTPNRLPYTGVSYVERMTLKREAEERAAEEAKVPNWLNVVCKAVARTTYGLTVGVVVGVGQCVFNTRQTTIDIIEQIDTTIDFILCKGKSGPHGRHCMCGCRRIEPDDVMYPFWDSKKLEPLSWGTVCPCCDW